MSLLYEKNTRSFFVGILLLTLIMGLSGMLQFKKQERDICEMIAAHDTAMISSLLEQGFGENMIVEAVTSTDLTERGAELAGKLGITDDAEVWFFPYVNELQDRMSTEEIVRVGLFAAVFIAMTVIFLRKRDNLYNTAADTVSRYIEGDFSKLLPQADNGAVYRKKKKINTMATALKAGLETENNTKVFLKNTISDISHQLKTPLAALSMYNEIIQEEPDNIETVKTFSEKSLAAVGRMESLIKTLLKLTRLDAGGIEFHKDMYAIGEIISGACEELTDRAKMEQKEIKITGNVKDMIKCDIEWTREAVGNIVKNALDHTTEGGIVSISWEKTPLMFRISIADDGRGIADEDIYHIFKRFYRSKNALDTHGAGLGLPLAKSIAEGQGGTIAVKSREGEGTVFTLSFPL